VIEHVLTVRVRDAWYALDAVACEQVLGDLAWLPLRRGGRAVRGIYFWRRQALPVIDLTEGQGPAAWSMAPRAVIFKSTRQHCALLCEEAREAEPSRTIVKCPHAFGEEGVQVADAIWPLVTPEGVSARISQETASAPAQLAARIGAAVLFQVGPVDIAIPTSLVEQIGTWKGADVLDPRAALELPSYEELTEFEGANRVVVCNVGGRRVGVVANSEIRMVEGTGGHPVSWLSLANDDAPAPTSAVLGWGKRPAILLEESYLAAYLERVHP
jgi:chemotaxis signal transduction protein